MELFDRGSERESLNNTVFEDFAEATSNLQTLPNKPVIFQPF